MALLPSMPSGNPESFNLNKVLPMSPDRTVTHVPGLDRTEPHFGERTYIAGLPYSGSKSTALA